MTNRRGIPREEVNTKILGGLGTPTLSLCMLMTDTGHMVCTHPRIVAATRDTHDLWEHVLPGDRAINT
jgi:hypothetical protein